jgi:hypothetical protein
LDGLLNHPLLGLDRLLGSLLRRLRPGYHGGLWRGRRYGLLQVRRGSLRGSRFDGSFGRTSRLGLSLNDRQRLGRNLWNCRNLTPGLHRGDFFGLLAALWLRHCRLSGAGLRRRRFWLHLNDQWLAGLLGADVLDFRPRLRTQPAVRRSLLALCLGPRPRLRGRRPHLGQVFPGAQAGLCLPPLMGLFDALQKPPPATPVFIMNS